MPLGHARMYSLLQAIAWGLRWLLSAMLFAVASGHAADGPLIFREGMSGDAVCTSCHGADAARPVLSIHLTRHGVAGQPGCQACHGSSRAHVQFAGTQAERPAPDFVFGGPNRSTSELQNRTCLNCHQGGARIHWHASAHPVNDVSCAACHTVHRSQDPALQRASEAQVCMGCHLRQRAQQHYLSTHSLENGAVTCSSCHNPHGSAGQALLREPSVNATCFTCHADKRGPFLWEHPPASDDCSNCHVPHGSNIAPLLKVRAPWLCQSCHGGSVHTSAAFSGRGLSPGAGGSAASAQLLLRACTNCHSAIHGSNHPSGARFTR